LEFGSARRPAVYGGYVGGSVYGGYVCGSVYDGYVGGSFGVCGRLPVVRIGDDMTPPWFVEVTI
jgi:hypothetical protein